jgi:hypothetical protein
MNESDINQLVTQLNNGINGLHAECLKKEKEISALRNAYTEKLKALQAEYSSKENEILSLKNSLNNCTAAYNKLKSDAAATVQRLQKENNEYKQSIERLEKENSVKRKVVNTSEKDEQQQINTYNDYIINKFNQWAGNPSRRQLPSGFSYLSGEIKIRTNQALKATASETKWICNINDNQKYLFPNPNFFDQMTDISELYVMDLSMLKEKGRNRIKITKPCEIVGDGFINFPGKLELI